MGDAEACNTGLGLGIGMGEYVPKYESHKDKPLVRLDLSFLLPPKNEAVNAEYMVEGSSSKTIEEDEEQVIKNSDYNNNYSNKNCVRKKLRLAKEQTTLLEESFKLHSTLNPTQKGTLAEQLNLRPRQVEVWFQNRRARTKLKQTEVDCELLKKYCQSLGDENRRLKKELQELRSLKHGQLPLCIQLPNAATLTVCPSCERLVKAISGKNAAVLDVVRKTNSYKLLQSGFDGTS